MSLGCFYPRVAHGLLTLAIAANTPHTSSHLSRRYCMMACAGRIVVPGGDKSCMPSRSIGHSPWQEIERYVEEPKMQPWSRKLWAVLLSFADSGEVRPTSMCQGNCLQPSKVGPQDVNLNSRRSPCVKLFIATCFIEHYYDIDSTLLSGCLQCVSDARNFLSTVTADWLSLFPA